MPKTCCKPLYFPDRVDIQQDTSEDGSPQEEFSGPAFKSKIPCRLISVSGDETFRGRQLEAHLSFVCECGYIAGVIPTMRLLVVGGIHAGKLLNISHVNAVQEKGQMPAMRLYCRELVVV